MKWCGSATSQNEAQQKGERRGRRAREERDPEAWVVHCGVAVEPNVLETHLHDGECLVIQQLLLSQVIFRRGPALFPVLRNAICGGGGYLLRNEQFKVVFD